MESERLYTRVNAELKREIVQAAKLEDMTISDYIRDCVRSNIDYNARKNEIEIMGLGRLEVIEKISKTVLYLLLQICAYLEQTDEDIMKKIESDETVAETIKKYLEGVESGERYKYVGKAKK